MKKFTKHFLLLALMLFGAIGASWAQQHKLDSIPTTWQARVNGVAKTVTAYTAGNKQKGHIDNIIENDSVTLIPDNPRRVNSVTLAPAPVPQLINIGGITLDITGCTTWYDIIARNPGVIWVDASMVVGNKGFLVIVSNSNLVPPSSTYTPPSSNYGWIQP